VDEREIEIKLPLERKIAVKNRLLSLGATLHRRRHFEDNLVFDFSDGRLRRRGLLLRLRMTQGKSTLTFKGPSRVIARTKSRREVEAEVPEGREILRILDLLGLRCRFRYQKFRTSYQKGRTLITIDETPIGTYLEIEGARDSIRKLARLIGYSEKDFITDSYYELFRKYTNKNRVTKKNISFSINS
jgi:adenylate cyclase class 2